VRRAQQSLAADGAIACFSSNFFLLSLNADRAAAEGHQRWASSPGQSKYGGMALMLKMKSLLIVGFVLICCAFSASAQRGPSTPEERKRAVEMATFLETTPL